jgi:hypothetical protein
MEIYTRDYAVRKHHSDGTMDFVSATVVMASKREAAVLEALVEERAHQDAKHGTIDEAGHTIGDWIHIIEAELAEAKRALIKGGTGRNSVLSELVQVMASAAAALEQHGTHEIKERTV